MIEVDLSMREAEILLCMERGEIVSSRFEKPIKLNGLQVMLTKLEVVNNRQWGGFEYDVRVKAELMPIQVVKSKQQFAAEEAVKKAEESLQAAKATLEKIKENK